jgi:hypothetical protein
VYTPWARAEPPGHASKNGTIALLNSYPPEKSTSD